MKTQRWLLANVCALLAAGFLSGCQSPRQYVSPRVTGRVLDGVTHQPLPGVQISRLTADEDLRIKDSPKTAAHAHAQASRTRADGGFRLDSRRGLAMFQNPPWYSVTLCFEHTGYEQFTTTYTVVNATNNPAGEPVVHAGDILLLPL